MKKLLGSSMWILALCALFLTGSTQAQSWNCETITTTDGSVCIWIEKLSNNQYRLRSTTSNNTFSIPSLTCDIEIDGLRQFAGACDSTFSSNTSGIRSVIVDVRFNSSGILRRITRNYDFGRGEWSGSSSSWNHTWNNLTDLSLSTNRSNPSINQSVDLTIRAQQSSNQTLTNYGGTVNFAVQYRSCSTCNWTTASSRDYTLNRSSYTFGSNNYGVVTLSNIISFRTSGQYRLSVRDSNNNITRYIEFNVGGSSFNTTVNRFTLTASRLNPSVNQSVDITIDARDNNNNIAQNYRGTARWTVQHRSCSTCSWTTASSRDYTLNRSSYTFGTYDYGTVMLNNLISFRTNGLYRLVVEDTSNYITNYLEFNVGGSSNTYGSLQNFSLWASRSNPSRNQTIDVTIRPQDSRNNLLNTYRGTVYFSVQYRAFSNSNRTTAPWGDYTLNRTQYTFTNNDNGEVRLNNLIEFKTNGQYRLVLEDRNANITNYLEFNVGGSSSGGGSSSFSTTQLNQIQAIYNLRPRLIDDLKSKYPRLRTNISRATMEADLYREMFNITRNVPSVYSNYGQFFNAFRDRYIYTLQIR